MRHKPAPINNGNPFSWVKCGHPTLPDFCAHCTIDKLKEEKYLLLYTLQEIVFATEGVHYGRLEHIQKLAKDAMEGKNLECDYCARSDKPVYPTCSDCYHET